MGQFADVGSTGIMHSSNPVSCVAHVLSCGCTVLVYLVGHFTFLCLIDFYSFDFDSSASPSMSNDSVQTLCVVGGLNDTSKSRCLDIWY